MTTETLQELINKRAKARMNADFNELWKTVYNHRILGDQDMPSIVGYSFKKDGETSWTSMNIRTLLSSSTLLNQLKAYWLPKYIAEETEKFVNQVESLKDQIDSLYQQIPS